MYISQIASYNNVQNRVIRQKSKNENESSKRNSQMERVEISTQAKAMSILLQEALDGGAADDGVVSLDDLKEFAVKNSDESKEKLTGHLQELNISEDTEFTVKKLSDGTIVVSGDFEQREILEKSLNEDKEFVDVFDKATATYPFIASVDTHKNFSSVYGDSSSLAKPEIKREFNLTYSNGEVLSGMSEEIKRYYFA